MMSQFPPPPSAIKQSGPPPISQPFPGSLTPGWNDPPSVQYNPEASGSVGRKLNKRVPFPLQGDISASQLTASMAEHTPPQQFLNSN